jgi:hypothetical protein
MGLFACAGYLIFSVSGNRRYQLTFLGDYLKKHLCAGSSSVFSIFVWFMKQSERRNLNVHDKKCIETFIHANG